MLIKRRPNCPFRAKGPSAGKTAFPSFLHALGGRLGSSRQSLGDPKFIFDTTGSKIMTCRICHASYREGKPPRKCKGV